MKNSLRYWSENKFSIKKSKSETVFPSERQRCRLNYYFPERIIER